jgi:hypothetical protein
MIRRVLACALTAVLVLAAAPAGAAPATAARTVTRHYSVAQGEAEERGGAAPRDRPVDVQRAGPGGEVAGRHAAAALLVHAAHRADPAG